MKISIVLAAAKRKAEVAKLRAEYEAIIRVKDAKANKMKECLSKLQDKLSEEKDKWQNKLTVLNDELTSANGRVCVEKRKQRDAVQRQLDIASEKRAQMKNCIEILEDDNAALEEEWFDAINEQEAAKTMSHTYKVLAALRLDKWHSERNARREAEDELARESKAVLVAEEIVDSYKALAETNAENKRRMKKEWADEASKAKRGGRKRWPVWVVQLICELVVNGTAPTAVPANIQIMYETLYGEKTDDLPSVHFVCLCRPVVEVIGETIAAIKLADAGNWDQLWTDATTRRQIPFTALIIGVIGNSDKIDPIVVSSYIFMEDESSERQADGIINKVSTTCKLILIGSYLSNWLTF